MLMKTGFDSKFFDWIMLCLSTMSYFVSLNVQYISPIIPGRGLRQGDPLSPYLFIIFVKRLATMMTVIENRGDIHGCRISKGAPTISHLLFVNNRFFFFNAYTDECGKMKGILSDYERMSGQAANLQKSVFCLVVILRPLL